MAIGESAVRSLATHESGPPFRQQRRRLGDGRQMAGPFEAADSVDVLHALTFVPDAPVVEI